jgi:hypothetical protein
MRMVNLLGEGECRQDASVRRPRGLDAMLSIAAKIENTR